MDFMIRFIVLLAAIFIAGCDKQITQRVEGRLIADGSPVASTEVRLSSGDTAETCPNSSLLATVKAGAFSLERKVWLGGLKVLVQNDALCIRENGAWVLAWHNIYGPAPKTLTVNCNKASGRWGCIAN